MTLQAPQFAQNDNYNASALRQLLAFLSPTGGVVDVDTDLVVTQRGSGANMSVDVSAGTVFVPGTDITGQGSYLCVNDDILNVAINSAPGSGQSRIDLIVAAVRDADVIGGVNNDWTIEAIAGTAASSPTAPSAPDSCVVLAQVLVGSSVSAIVDGNITDKRSYAGGLPQGLAYQSGSGVELGASVTPIPTASSEFLRGGMSIASGKLVIPRTGIYRVDWSVGFCDNIGGTLTATGYCNALLLKNGTEIARGAGYGQSGTLPTEPISRPLHLADGDTLELAATTFNTTFYAHPSAKYTWLGAKFEQS